MAVMKKNSNEDRREAGGDPPIRHPYKGEGSEEVVNPLEGGEPPLRDPWENGDVGPSPEPVEPAPVPVPVDPGKDKDKDKDKDKNK